MERPEQTIHKAVVQHLRLRGVSGLVFWHTQNSVWRGGRKAAVQGGIAKSMGVRAGVSDLLLFHAGRMFCLELKARGRATEHQLEFICEMERAGAYCCIAEGIDAALAALDAWQLVRGTVCGRGGMSVQATMKRADNHVARCCHGQTLDRRRAVSVASRVATLLGAS